LLPRSGERPGSPVADGGFSAPSTIIARRGIKQSYLAATRELPATFDVVHEHVRWFGARAERVTIDVEG
jgi:hypothetical protein